jgi:hypothetical protein
MDSKSILVALITGVALVIAALIAAFSSDLSALLHPSDNRVIWVTGSVRLPLPDSRTGQRFVGGEAKVRYSDAAAGMWKTNSIQSCLTEGDSRRKENNCSYNSPVDLRPGTNVYNFMVNLPLDTAPWWKDRTEFTVMVCAMPMSALYYFSNPPQ